MDLYLLICSSHYQETIKRQNYYQKNTKSAEYLALTTNL